MMPLKNSKALYINGEWQRAANFEPVVNPANEEPIAEAPVGTVQHAEAALEDAVRAVEGGPG